MRWLDLVTITLTATFAAAAVPIEGQLVRSELLPEFEISPSTRVVLNGGAQTSFVDADGGFYFDNVDDGVHLIEVLSREYYFPKVRVAITGNNMAASMHVDGTNWNSVGPEVKIPLQLSPKVVIDPFMPRPKMTLMSLVMANPMLLMMGGTFALFFFLPKMMEGLDPEELKKMQENRANQPKLEMPDVSESLANWFAPTAPAAAAAAASPAKKK